MQAQAQALLPAPLPPGNVLFFGCRRRDQDFYWEAEWEQLQARGCLTLVTAFSRETDNKQLNE